MFRLRNGGKMYLNTLGKNEMYMSVAEILETDIKVIKNFVIENNDEIVDCHYDEYGIEQMDLGNFINGNGIKRIDRYLFHNYFFSLCLLWHRLFCFSRNELSRTFYQKNKQQYYLLHYACCVCHLAV